MIRSEEVARIARVTCVSAVVVTVGAGAVGVQIGSTLVVTGVFATFLLLTYGRGRYQAWISGQRSIGNFGRRVVIVGDPDEASWLVDLLQDSPELGYVAVGFTGPLDPDRVGPSVPWLGSFDDVESAVATTGAGGVVISATSMSSAALTGLVRRLHQKQIHVLLASGITGMHRRRLRVQPVGYQPLIYVEAESLSQLQLAAKRALDVVGATIGLIASAPLLLGAAIAIKGSDGGPVLFRQQRIGRDGQAFTILKLRTMCVDAESRLAEVDALNERQGPLFKASDDPRVTSVGRFLRASSIDELPQLVHVLRGTMSLVGPRPALRSEIAAVRWAAHRPPPGEARDDRSLAGRGTRQVVLRGVSPPRSVLRRELVRVARRGHPAQDRRRRRAPSAARRRPAPTHPSIDPASGHAAGAHGSADHRSDVGAGGVTTSRRSAATQAGRVVLVVHAWLALISGYLLALTAVAWRARRRGADETSTSSHAVHRFAILVPAHDEEALIADTVRSMVEVDYPADLFTVHVVADNCHDDTANVARVAGATAHQRDEPERPGKGPALGWLLDRLRRGEERYDAYVVVDADSVLDRRFLRVMDARLAAGERVIQAHYTVRDPGRSWSVGLRFAALAARHHLRPLARSSLGLSAGLFGNGMVFKEDVLRDRGFSDHLTEDIELHMELLLAGERVSFAADAVLAAEMPATLRASRSQQERWERGRLEMTRTYVPRLLRRPSVQRRGQRMAQLEAAADQLVPPLSMAVGATVGAGIAAHALLRLVRTPLARLNAALSIGLVLAQAAHVLASLRMVRAPRTVYRSLVYAPLMVAWKLPLLAQVASPRPRPSGGPAPLATTKTLPSRSRRSPRPGNQARSP